MPRKPSKKYDFLQESEKKREAYLRWAKLAFERFIIGENKDHFLKTISIYKVDLPLPDEKNPIFPILREERVDKAIREAMSSAYQNKHVEFEVYVFLSEARRLFIANKVVYCNRSSNSKLDMHMSERLFYDFAFLASRLVPYKTFLEYDLRENCRFMIHCFEVFSNISLLNRFGSLFKKYPEETIISELIGDLKIENQKYLRMYRKKPTSPK